MTKLLLEKYSQALPRYTSYPTYPHWQEEAPSMRDWLAEVVHLMKQGKSLSLYLHLPFCESLCTYCGCNKRITKNHAVEAPYIESLLKEFSIYQNAWENSLDKAWENSSANAMDKARENEQLESSGTNKNFPSIDSLHLGGGTPTFFSAESLDFLLSSLLSRMSVRENHEFAVEVHPNHTNPEQLKVLAKHGFNRISVGVQDFDPLVQGMTHRRQSFEDTQAVIEQARKLGFEGVNVDAIYGLPGQKLSSVKDTFHKIIALRPDRIAFYSYAHVPWKSPSQRGYSEEDLPKGMEKLELFEQGRAMLLGEGYVEIGMDHFALTTDPLTLAMKQGKLKRNFMGYTLQHSEVLLGLGASSISQTENYYVQNEKHIEDYQASIAQGLLPITKGHHLNPKEKHTRNLISSILCQGKVDLRTELDEVREYACIDDTLLSLLEDGLIELKGETLYVKPLGRPFLRNIASCFDPHLAENLKNKKGETNRFSNSV